MYCPYKLEQFNLTSISIASANMFLMKPSSTLRILVEMRGIEGALFVRKNTP